ncbi:hypothetical protein DM82_4958 [Burkholderia oklahomensis]|uniref:Uncharacterized protein n=1 Tax=Burkholderia oklahomensis TaxID=342113 RepID=A0AAI8FQK0_9BURK|nr:hypothetical protein [Burkholderia oklahomensis]AIO69766.1 hypothetical protein DM82_4958 [Burkholderia oklahomensis]SUY26595.1 Uncharacterised protein [Burkholderia oklahomensis]
MSVGTVNRNSIVLELGGGLGGTDAQSPVTGMDQQILNLLRQQLQQRNGVGAEHDASGAGAPMTAQSAAGALGSYMSQNGLGTVDPDKLYQLAMNPSSGTPDDVSKAAKFMLDHPAIYQKLETHDVAGADGISGVGNFQWAAQGGLDSASTAPTADASATDGTHLGVETEGEAPRMTAQSAAGALGSYMSQNGLSTVDPDKLYQLAMNPPSGTPGDVSKAAKFMLDHPDVYQKLETHDVAGADGISGVGNFQWAAEGGLDSLADAGAAAGSEQASGDLGQTPQMIGAQSQAFATSSIAPDDSQSSSDDETV